MPDNPQQLDVNVRAESPPRLDPQRNDPYWLKVIGSATAFGVIVFLFTWQFVKSDGQADRIIEKIQVMLDKAEERNSKERDREISRIDKQHEASEARLRDWNKTLGERQALEADKLRMEMKTLSESVKLLVDRIRLTTMKD